MELLQVWITAKTEVFVRLMIFGVGNAFSYKNRFSLDAEKI